MLTGMHRVITTYVGILQDYGPKLLLIPRIRMNLMSCSTTFPKVYKALRGMQDF